MNQKFKPVINLRVMVVINLTRFKAGTCILRRAMGLVYFVLVSFAVSDWPALCNNCILHGPLQVTARSFFPCTRFLSAIISGALILSCTSFIARKSMNATQTCKNWKIFHCTLLQVKYEAPFTHGLCKPASRLHACAIAHVYPID